MSHDAAGIQVCLQVGSVVAEQFRDAPDEAAARNYLAWCLMELNRHNEALNMQRETVERFPDDIVARNLLAAILRRLASPQETVGPSLNTEGCLVLTSGRKIWSLNGRLSCRPEFPNELGAGADNTSTYDGSVEEPLTADERSEIVNFMISRWRSWGSHENRNIKEEA